MARCLRRIATLPVGCPSFRLIASDGTWLQYHVEPVFRTLADARMRCLKDGEQVGRMPVPAGSAMRLMLDADAGLGRASSVRWTNAIERP